VRESDQNAHLQHVNSAFDSLRSPLRGQPTAVTALRFVSPVFALRWLPRLRFFNGLLVPIFAFVRVLSRSWPGA
jgi:hypothetical protein